MTLAGKLVHPARALAATVPTSSLVGNALYQEVQRRRVTREMLRPAPPTGRWVLQVGETVVEAGPDDRTPADVWGRRSGDELPPLFVEGRPVAHDDPFDALSAIHPLSRVAVGGFHAFEGMDGDPVDRDYESFRYDDEWAFVDGHRTARDVRQLATYWLGRWHDPVLYRTAMNELIESPIGWGSVGPPPWGTLANTTWAHAYVVALLSRFMGPEAGLRVIEIGGGYGGLAQVRATLRPALFRSHVIVDLPQVNELQRWFLGRHAGCEMVEPVPVRSADRLEPADLVIATHSLTELNVDQINRYLETTVLPAGAVLLALQRRFFGLPHSLDWVVRRLVDSGFRLVNLDVLDGRNVVCVLLIR